MNLIIRLLYIALFSRFRPKQKVLDRCVTPFRTNLMDLDVLMHMNNGRYLSIQDLARVDLMNRSGVLPIFNSKGWYPVVVSETIQFRKSLKLFEKFVIETQVMGWTDKDFVLEHVFKKGEQIVAHGYVMSRFLKKSGGPVSIQEVLEAAGISEQREMPERVKPWVEHQRLARAHFA